MKRALVGAAALLAVVVTACSAPSTARSTAGRHAEAPVVFAAIGASETFGVGADDRYRQAWPQIFFNDVLPPSSTLYNFGLPGATTEQALKDEVPPALAVHPKLVTVWLSINDLEQGVSPSTYASRFQQLVHALRQGGKARVLVANVPDLTLLPAFKACLQEGASSGINCPISPNLVPSAQQIQQLISAYNEAITRVVSEEGATLVDVHAKDALIAQHPEWISADGLHPNGLGYEQIAKSFEDAYRTSR